MSGIFRTFAFQKKIDRKMAEYEVTGVRYQMGDNLTLEQMTQAAEEFKFSYKKVMFIISIISLTTAFFCHILDTL